MASPYETGFIGTFGLSADSRITPLVWPGFKWGTNGAGTSAAVTYSFPTYGSLWHSDYSIYLSNEPYNNFQPFDTSQQAAAELALAKWAEVANITFTELDDKAGDTDVGDIRFGNSGAVTNSTSAAWAYIPYEDNIFTYAESGDVWFDYQYAPNLELLPGQFGFSTMLHEIGHAIGLDHPFADGYGEPTLPLAQQNQRYTIMAYSLYSGATIEAYGPMLYDILAIQYIYGANMTTRAGDDVYTFQTDKEYLECIWDAGGHDTIDLSNQTRNQVIDLRAGTFSSIGVKNNGQTAVGNVAIAFNVTIEDAVGGSGHDRITGNNVANLLEGGGGNDTIAGGAGNDTLDGGAGIDSMSGGQGNDLYLVDSALDKVVEAAGEGIDTVESTVSYSFALNPNAEILKLVGAGNLNGTGNAIANTLIGNDGSNILDGGGAADILKGGKGNDTYILDHAGDVVDEEGNADSGDTVKSGALIAGAFAGIENYFYAGTLAWSFTADGSDNLLSGGGAGDNLGGAGGNDTLLGNGGNDVLAGNEDDDWLDGGAGNDKMKGGAGNDTYVLGALGDSIDEEGNTDSDDVVRSSISVNLALLASGALEHVVLTGTTAINATGNGAANSLTGNAAANKLDGGIGADTMIGGNGADIYWVDDAGDEVVETTGGTAGGIDLVMSKVDFDLTSLVNVEKVTLIGSGDIDAIGNGLANTLLGNDGANILDGKGGNDTLTGGKGDDTYVVNSIGDVVNETVLNSAGGGIDTVISSVAFTLATRTNIEHLTLTGSANINGTGNALNNTLIGNSGNNTLNGGAGNDILEGGDGNDTLIGGTGNDVFDFDSLGDLGDSDLITDFLKGTDKIDIHDLLLEANYVGSDIFADGILSFTYSGTTTNLWFDQDGTAATYSALALTSLLNVHLTSTDGASFIT